MSAPAAASSSSAASGVPLYGLHHAHSHAALAQLPEPKLLFQHLLMCLETPRPSNEPGKNHLKGITDKLLSFGKDQGLDAAVDEIGNIRLRASATKGFEGATRICLQSHVDVVCSAANDKIHDFTRDFVLPIVEGNVLRADRTTLGADDGVGVAASMALLEERDSFEHGPLEAVFTVDEETSMAGAEFMAKAPFLQSDVLINVDSEESGSICVGCAGGFEQALLLPLQRVPQPEGLPVVQVHLHSLLGGHTGIDIDKGRANALILAARLLNAAMTRDNISSLQLQSLSGGNAPNAIPRDATFVVVLPSKESEALFRASLDKTFARIQTEFAHIERRLTKDSPTEEGPEARYEPCMVMEVTSVTTAPPAGALVTTPEQTRKLVALMLNVPHGPLKINLALDHAVDTSISFSIAKLNATAPVAAAAAAASGDGAAPVVEEDHFLVHVFARSSFEDDMLDVNSSLEALALLSGAQLKHGRGRGLNPFPGWKPRLDSPALKQVVATHRALFGKEARVYSVHAGLECGLLYGNYPGLDCVSIGPTIHHAHSPQECLMLDTVEPFYKWLKQSVVNISRASLAK